MSTGQVAAVDSATGRLAAWCSEMSIEKMPKVVVDRALGIFVDTLACILAGVPQHGPQVLWKLTDADPAKPGTIFGSALKADAKQAALANGTAAHALDLDDYNKLIFGHVSAVMVPAAFAAGELVGASGAKLLEAYVAGYEVWAVVGGHTRAHYLAGFHTTSTTGALAAAVVAGKIMGLSVDQLRTAMGIAGSYACGLHGNFGTDVKPYHAGLGASQGIASAILAANGFTASQNTLDEQFGFMGVFCPAEREAMQAWQPPESYDDLRLARMPLTQKIYPSCGATHSAIDAVLDIRGKNKIDPESVREIVVGANGIFNQVLMHHNPQTGIQGKFSMEYCVALALTEGTPRIDHFTDQCVQRPDLRALLKKVKFVLSPRHDALEKADEGFGAEVEIKADSGTYSCDVIWPMGHTYNPIAMARLVEKFRECAPIALPADQAREALAMLTELQALGDVRQLTKKLAVAAK